MDANKGANDFPERLRIRVTCGAVLANGAAIELVAGPSSEALQLLFWDRKDFKIDLQIPYGDVLYQPPYLPPAVFQAVRFPSSPGEYGSPRELFGEIASLLRQGTGLDETGGMGTALWVRSTWFPDLYPSPPLLYVTGPERRALRLFRMLRALCRHSLMVAELNRSLPFYLQPTLIIYDPALSPRRQASWRASNHRGIYVPQKGTLGNLASAKAVFSENEDSPDGWGASALRINLLPSTDPVPEWTDREEWELAALYQPQLLMYRLRNLPKTQEALSRACPPQAKSELARCLLAGVQDIPDIVQGVMPLLVAHEEEMAERRSIDPKVVLVECLWGPAHEVREIRKAEVLKRMNALLRNRGESYAYNDKELGWKFRALRIPRHRDGNGTVVRFSSEVRRQLHVLAQRFGLDLPRKKSCANCKTMQAAVR